MTTAALSEAWHYPADQDEDRHLHECGHTQNRETQRDGPKAGTGAHDRTVGEPVRVSLRAVVMVWRVAVRVVSQLGGQSRESALVFSAG